MSKAMLVHDFSNLNAMAVGYSYFGQDEHAKHCKEVMRMIESGSIKTKTQVVLERRKRGIERK